jgi:hypothetical protein
MLRDQMILQLIVLVPLIKICNWFIFDIWRIRCRSKQCILGCRF